MVRGAMLKRAVKIILGVVVVIALWLLNTFYAAGAFKTIHPHFDGECRLVRGASGPEDLTISKDGIAYVAAYDRRATGMGKPKPGAIYAYELADPAKGLINLTPNAGLDFEPHGVSLWRDDDGSERLFVVNHPTKGEGRPDHTIEIFDIKDRRLEHRRSLVDSELLRMPNDILAVGRDRFFVTNTHYNRPGLWQTLETWLRFKRAQVVYFDGSGFRVAIADLQVPNGINLSPDGRTLYLASTTGRELRLYTRNPVSDTLVLSRRLALGSGADNVDVDAAGNVWVAAHPNMLALIGLRNSPTALSPSQILKVTADGTAVEEIYLDGGEQISGASVGAVVGNRLLMGQIFGDGILDCTMNTAEKARQD
jgi:arylesterase/paraoxonase